MTGFEKPASSSSIQLFSAWTDCYQLRSPLNLTEQFLLFLTKNVNLAVLEDVHRSGVKERPQCREILFTCKGHALKLSKSAQVTIHLKYESRRKCRMVNFNITVMFS